MSSNDEQGAPYRAQFLMVKRVYPGAIVLFRIGDFLEAFDEDAETIARECGINLSRLKLHPMAGFPAHASKVYIDQLTAKGYRVALCEQVS